MTDIVIFEDGKLGRGQRAFLVKRRGKEVLIRYYDQDLQNVVQKWFMKYRRDKRHYYYSFDFSNLFYYDEPLAGEIQQIIKKYKISTYYQSLYGENNE